MCAAGDDVCCCTTVGSGVVDGSFIFLRLLLLVDRDICAADAVGSGLDGSSGWMFAASFIFWAEFIFLRCDTGDTMCAAAVAVGSGVDDRWGWTDR